MATEELQQSPSPAPPAARPVEQAVTAPVQSPPVTAQQVDALRARRAELSRQLTSAADRRSELARELLKASGASNRSGLEQRVAQLDQRIMQIESDLADVGRQMSMAPAQLITSTSASSRPWELTSGEVTGIAIVFTVMVLFPLAIAVARLVWKRASSPRPTTKPADSDPRLERLEQAVDAIAIEIERVSEGQRFVTQLLTRDAASHASGVGEGSDKAPRGRILERVRATGNAE